MNFSKAKQEFEIRYYRWATVEFEREIDEGFPNFRLFKTGAVWELYYLMQQLPKPDRLTAAHGLLKRFHPDAVKALGETCSTEEKALRDKRDSFFNLRRSYQFIQQLEKNNQLAEARQLFQSIRQNAIGMFGEPYFNDYRSLRTRLDTAFSLVPLSLEESIAARKLAGEKIKFISKRKLLKVVATRFQAAFNDTCRESDRWDEGDLSLSFEMKCRGWNLGTHFWFGRHNSLINYSHSIASETDFELQGAAGKYMGPLVLGSSISFTDWLGITSQIEWECLVDEEVEPACEAAIKFCRHFFEAAPKLLEGLNPATITVD